MAKEKSLAPGASPRGKSEDKPLTVRRGRVESVDLFEIKENELDLFEKGSPADLQLNFSIFLLSLAFSGICTLSTATFPNDTIKYIFLFVTIIGVMFGGYLLLIWWNNRISLKETCRKIRERIPPDAGYPKHTESSNVSTDFDKTKPKG